MLVYDLIRWADIDKFIETERTNTKRSQDTLAAFNEPKGVLIPFVNGVKGFPSDTAELDLMTHTKEFGLYYHARAQGGTFFFGQLQDVQRNTGLRTIIRKLRRTISEDKKYEGTQIPEIYARRILSDATNVEVLSPDVKDFDHNPFWYQRRHPHNALEYEMASPGKLKQTSNFYRALRPLKKRDLLLLLEASIDEAKKAHTQLFTNSSVKVPFRLETQDHYDKTRIPTKIEYFVEVEL